MNLYFSNSKGEKRFLCKVNNRQATMTEINKFLKEHNYQSHYIRMWATESEELGHCMKFDVGSWTEFFYLQFEKPTDKEYFLKE